jgi:hypothetical protein
MITRVLSGYLLIPLILTQACPGPLGMYTVSASIPEGAEISGLPHTVSLTLPLPPRPLCEGVADVQGQAGREKEDSNNEEEPEPHLQ